MVSACNARPGGDPVTELGTKLPRDVSGEEFLVSARRSTVLPDAGGRRVMNGAMGV